MKRLERREERGEEKGERGEGRGEKGEGRREKGEEREPLQCTGYLGWGHKTCVFCLRSKMSESSEAVPENAGQVTISIPSSQSYGVPIRHLSFTCFHLSLHTFHSFPKQILSLCLIVSRYFEKRIHLQLILQYLSKIFWSRCSKDSTKCPVPLSLVLMTWVNCSSLIT